jgi:hypothetical protein
MALPWSRPTGRILAQPVGDALSPERPAVVACVPGTPRNLSHATKTAPSVVGGGRRRDPPRRALDRSAAALGQVPRDRAGPRSDRQLVWQSAACRPPCPTRRSHVARPLAALAALIPPRPCSSNLFSPSTAPGAAQADGRTADVEYEYDGDTIRDNPRRRSTRCASSTATQPEEPRTGAGTVPRGEPNRRPRGAAAALDGGRPRRRCHPRPYGRLLAGVRDGRLGNAESARRPSPARCFDGNTRSSMRSRSAGRGEDAGLGIFENPRANCPSDRRLPSYSRTGIGGSLRHREGTSPLVARARCKSGEPGASAPTDPRPSRRARIEHRASPLHAWPAEYPQSWRSPLVPPSPISSVAQVVCDRLDPPPPSCRSSHDGACGRRVRSNAKLEYPSPSPLCHQAEAVGLPTEPGEVQHVAIGGEKRTSSASRMASIREVMWAVRDEARRLLWYPAVHPPIDFTSTCSCTERRWGEHLAILG